MISREVILKAFDNTIKSHQHLRLNGKCLPVFDAFHDKHCGKKPRKSEISVWVDSEGNDVFTKKGTKNRVGFTEREIRENYEKYGEMNVTHNHPRDNLRPPIECLSDGDVAFILDSHSHFDGDTGVNTTFYPFKSISCESSNGSRMTLVRGDKFANNTREQNSKVREARKELQNYFQSYYDNYYETMSKVRQDYNMDDFPNYVEYRNTIIAKTFEQTGYFEKSSKFKEIQQKFREGNCKLTMTQPRDFQVGLWE